MKCLTCQKDLTSERSTKRFCGNSCRQKWHDAKVSVTRIVPLSVSQDPKATLIPLSVGSEPVSVTPELEKRLNEIYKAHEKKYNGRFRGPNGTIKIPDIKCQPCYIDGKRVLTEWEKIQLSAPIVEEVKEDTHKVLVFTSKDKLEDRIAAYKEEYKGVTYIPNWILHGFDSKEEALKEAMKAVVKSVGESNSGL